MSLSPLRVDVRQAPHVPPITSSVDISQVIDEHPMSRAQLMAVVLAALAIVVDGFDGQLIGYAIPSIMKDWGLTKAAFAPVVASGLVGMALGSTFGGVLADRVGRKLALALSVMTFGVATSLIGLSQDLMGLMLLRLVAGLGIGGALPCASTLAAEFSPQRLRTTAVTATIICYPLGGFLAGAFAQQVLPASGWRELFILGGLLPIAYSLVLLVSLPESPRFLARRAERRPQLARLLSRMGVGDIQDREVVDGVTAPASEPSRLHELFNVERRMDTLPIWAGFFLIMLASYSAFSWLPTMLASEGLSLSLASGGLTAYNSGGVIGALICSACIGRFGSRRTLTVWCFGAAASAFAMQAIDFKTHADWLIIGFGIHGLFVTAVQATMYALCAHVYPTQVRATGTAAALSTGRLGAILSAFAGAAVITAGGGSAYLSLLGVAMGLAGAMLLCVRHHIPAR